MLRAASRCCRRRWSGTGRCPARRWTGSTACDAVGVGAGDYFACALRKSDGAGGGPSVCCWGDNTTAQLGTIEAGAPGTFNAQTIYTSYDPLQVPLP